MTFYSTNFYYVEFTAPCALGTEYEKLQIEESTFAMFTYANKSSHRFSVKKLFCKIQILSFINKFLELQPTILLKTTVKQM